MPRTWQALGCDGPPDPTLAVDLDAALAARPGSASLHHARGLVAGAGREAARPRPTAEAARCFRRALDATPTTRSPASAWSRPWRRRATGSWPPRGRGGRWRCWPGAAACRCGRWTPRPSRRASTSCASSGSGPPGPTPAGPTAEARAKADLLRWRLHGLLGELTGDLAHYREAALARPDLAPGLAALGCALGRAGRAGRGRAAPAAGRGGRPLRPRRRPGAGAGAPGRRRRGGGAAAGRRPPAAAEGGAPGRARRAVVRGGGRPAGRRRRSGLDRRAVLQRAGVHAALPGERAAPARGRPTSWSSSTTARPTARPPTWKRSARARGRPAWRWSATRRTPASRPAATRGWRVARPLGRVPQQRHGRDRGLAGRPDRVGAARPGRGDGRGGHELQPAAAAGGGGLRGAGRRGGVRRPPAAGVRRPGPVGRAADRLLPPGPPRRAGPGGRLRRALRAGLLRRRRPQRQGAAGRL